MKKRIKKHVDKKKKTINLDNLGIISGALQQKEQFQTMIKETDWVNHQYLSQTLNTLTAYTPEKDRDNLLMTLALIRSLETLGDTSKK